MSRQTPAVWGSLGAYASLLILAILGVFLALQCHATLVFAGLQAVKIQAVNRMGWNTSTINGLSRFLYLVIGALWLFAVSLLPRYLREAAQVHLLRRVVLRLLLIMGALYIVSYLTLLIL
jgi:hypothetical protein